MHGFSSNQTSLSFLNLVADSCEIDGWPNIFVTGTFDKEKAVSVQQLRAGTLALAVAARFQRRQHRVAVVGAGFSGIALSAILIRCGFEVDQFEQSDHPISAHLGCNKTYVHPNLHNWPDEPFLQNEFRIGDIAWCANIASRVSDQISRQFMALAENKRDRLRTFFGQRVRSVYRAGSQGGSACYKLVTDADDPGKIYDVVIFAVGFGWEAARPMLEAPLGYWQEFDGGSSGIEADPERTMISGKGDRALIDLLQCSLTNYEPDRVFEVFPRLCGDDLRTRVRVIEQRARLPGSGVDIFEEYRETFARETWTESIRLFGVNQTRQVFFNTRPPNIFSMRSSALNRVLVYFLIKEGLVELRPYELQQNNIAQLQMDGRTSYRILWSRGEKAEMFDKIVLRHGIKADYFWRSFPELRDGALAVPTKPVVAWSVCDLPTEVLCALQSETSRGPAVVGTRLRE